MLRKCRSDISRAIAAVLLGAVLLLANSFAGSAIIHLKNGDRLTGKIVSESTNSLTLATPLLGTLQVPLDQIEKREPIPDSAGTNSPANPSSPANLSTTNAPAGASSGTNTAAQAAGNVPELKAKKPPQKLSPANPEATPIASTPSLWKHDLRFGLNLHFAEQSSQEFLFIGKSTYGSPPWRHIFDVNFKYGHTDGILSENSLDASEKTEYQISPKTYLFSIVGGGYDEIRLIDVQYELGPGIGVELLKRTNFVWKTETGLNFQQQFRSDRTQESAYELRIAEILAWHVWEKLTADTKAEFFTNLGQIGEYRFRLEANLRYPVSDRISLNLDLIDLYDTESPDGVRPNDMQIRSTIGVTF